MITNMIEFTFSAALFINALLFIPQIIKIFKEKSAKGVSLLTFAGFLLIQLAIILHGVINHDHLLVFGYLFSVLTCGTVVVLILLYRKSAETIKNDQDLTFEKIMNQLPAYIYWKNKEGVCLGSNANNWRAVGLKSLEELQGKVDYQFFPKEEADRIRQADEDVMRTGELKVIEEVATMAGEQRLFLSHKTPLKNQQGDIIGVLGVSVDITDVKQKTEEQLRVLEDVIAVMPGNAYWLDKEGVYLGCNDNQAKFIGLQSRKEIIGKRNIEMPGFLIAEVLDKTNAAVISSGQAVTMEEPAILSDGTEATFLSNKVPLKNNKNEIIGMVGISIDITERKKQEQDLLEAKEKAEAANKAKTEFLAVMSHEFRTPLTGILGMINILCREDPPQALRMEYLEKIDMASKHLLSMINNVLDFAKLNENKFQLSKVPFDFSETLEQVFDIVGGAAREKNLELSIHYPPALPRYFIGDPKALLQILLNVASNAIKFTHNGRITITLEPKKITQKEASFFVVIEDTGIGIPKDKLDLIFEKFEQIDSSHTRAYGGTGLGLSVTKKLVELMGGSISVESELQKGSKFRIDLCLPINEKGERASTEGELDMNSLRVKKVYKVLLVEDDPLVQFVHQHKLEHLGCVVDTAIKGEVALMLFQSKKFDLIFMDIGLPDISGNMVIQRIRAAEKAPGTQRTPVIALTAYSDQENRKQSLAAGADDVLCKPVEDQKLREIIQRYT